MNLGFTMNKDQLDGLLALKLVADKRNFTAAAEELGISPPAISKMIKQLESRLGVALLSRTTRSTSLTEAGERFLNQAGAALDQILAKRAGGEGWGRIVNISSVHSQATMPGGFSVYASSKGAINSLTRELALELAPLGITVNAVAPGAIEVERFVSNPVYDRAALASEIPLGRVGKPEDIAGVVAFLCSDDASWLTGQVITVDGGTLTRLYLYAGRPIPSGPKDQTQDP